jgi:hypothetical protein
MTRRATGRFEFEAKEQPREQQGRIRLTRTPMTKTFHGDMEGTSIAERLMAYVLPAASNAIGFEDFAAAGGSGAYVGFEYFRGTLGAARAASCSITTSAAMPAHDLPRVRFSQAPAPISSKRSAPS